MSVYEIAKCEDTQRPALYRKFVAFHPGAMSGRELIAHMDDFDAIHSAIDGFFCDEELKVHTSNDTSIKDHQ